MKKIAIVLAIATVTALAVLSQPAMAYSPPYSSANYAGRYACHGASNNGPILTTGTWVVAPNGYGTYNDGELCLNFDPKKTLYGCDCQFQLETYGPYKSYYSVDPYYGFATEALTWKDYTSGSTADICSGSYFIDFVTSALVAAAGTWQAASQSLGADINLDDEYYPGSVNCVLGGSMPYTGRD